MSDEKNSRSFVFYESFMNSIEGIHKDDKYIRTEEDVKNIQLDVYRLIVHYGIEGIIISDVSPLAKTIFFSHQVNIDNAKQKHRVAIENGRKGGAPKGNKNNPNGYNQWTTKGQPKDNQNKPKDNLNVNVNDNVNVNKNVNKIIYKPTYEQVLEYGKQNNISEEKVQSFYNFYESREWKDKKGNSIYYDWKNKLEYWNQPNNKNKTIEDELPKYDDSKNAKLSEEEERELLALMGKQKEDRINTN